MNNKGKITVFLCLIISSMMILGLTVIKIVDRYSAREKVAMTGRVAMSNVRAEYNSYIFENYHILLFDMTCGNVGQGAMEEHIKGDLEKNLGNNFSVKNVAITDYTCITEEDCKALKEQISKYMMYGAVEDVSETILGSTGGEDGTLPDDVEDDLEDAISAEFSTAVEPSPEKEDMAAEGENLENEDSTYDPRDYTKTIGDLGILYFVVPEDMTVSRASVDISDTPSFESDSLLESAFNMNYEFDSISDFKSDVNSHSTWLDELTSAGCGLVYANKVFNSAVNKVNENTVFDFEVEYLICGKESDYKNLDGVVAKIVALRLPVNYAYLMSDASKISQIKKVSMPLSLLTCVPEIVVRHLVAGCWAYVESLCEVKNLLEGKKIPFKKSDSTWMTDLFDFENSMDLAMEEVEEGLSYDSYLIILLALEGEDIYLRMLDLMQLNASSNSGEIYMKNCAVELSVDIGVSYEGEDINFNITTGY